ncbi:LOW QUALITY PROTEIN: hypothetical protein SORBI_3001G261480 [Sorghum bicolor]|uniref:Uncharacterized protein n=1 Tax=Sorghum bicolor TaxID=4558 RepID=A0A1Z5S7K8_SORBI|nr:LOW QUALITY PROTEIN: hypothetical protein SORBI_3001G261480 [Sorghum bicolor]
MAGERPPIPFRDLQVPRRRWRRGRSVSPLPFARVPISVFRVGAVGLGASGRVYVGVSVEFHGVPLCHSVHAEQFLVANAAAAGGVRAARRRRLPHALRPLPPVPLGDPHRGGHAEQGLAPEWRTVASLLLHPFEAHNDALGDPVVAAAANGVAPGDLDACGGASREGITGLGRTHGEVRRGDVHEGAHQEQVAADQHHGLAPQAPGDAARQQRPHHAERIQRQREGRQRLVVVDAVHVLVAAARRALEQAWEELLQESLHLRHTSWTLLQVATDGATEFICSMSVLVFSVFYLLDGDA